MSRRCVWDKDVTTLFLNIAIRKNLKSKSKQVGVRNKHIYEEIAEEINQQLDKNVTWDKLKDKWNHLKKQYKEKRKNKHVEWTLMEQCFGDEQPESEMVSSSSNNENTNQKATLNDPLQDDMVSQSPHDDHTTVHEDAAHQQTSGMHQHFTELQTVTTDQPRQEQYVYAAYGSHQSGETTVPRVDAYQTTHVAQTAQASIAQENVLQQEFSMSDSQIRARNKPQEMPARVLQHHLTNVPQKMLANVPEQMSTNVPQQMSTNVLGQMSTNVPQQMSRNVPEQMSTNVPQQMSTTVLGQMSTYVPEQMATNVLNQVATMQPLSKTVSQQLLHLNPYSGASEASCTPAAPTTTHGVASSTAFHPHITSMPWNYAQQDVNLQRNNDSLPGMNANMNGCMNNNLEANEPSVSQWIASNTQNSQITNPQLNDGVDAVGQSSHQNTKNVHLSERKHISDIKFDLKNLCRSRINQYKIICNNDKELKCNWFQFGWFFVRVTAICDEMAIKTNFEYDVVKICLDVLSGKQQEIPEKLMEDVALCSSRLEVDGLFCEILKRNLTPLKKEYCSSSKYFAIKDAICSAEDKEVLAEYAANRCVSIYHESPDYDELSLNDIKTFIGEEGKSMTLPEPSKSKHLFWAIVKWVEFNQAERKQHLEDLLQLVTLERIPMDVMLCEKVIYTEHDVVQTVVECYKGKENYQTKKTQKTIVRYDYANKKWLKSFPLQSHICELNWPPLPGNYLDRDYFTIIKFRQSILIAGRIYFKKYIKLDYTEENCSWKEEHLAGVDMYCNLIVHEDLLYAFSYNDIMYCYDGKQWKQLSKCHCFARMMTSCGDYIYGIDDEGSFYRYDPSIDHWQKLQDVPDVDGVDQFPVARDLFTWRGFVCGLFDDEIHLYNVLSGSWEKITQAPIHGRSRLFERNDKIVLVGGSLYSYELYTYDGFKWTKHFGHDLKDIGFYSWMCIDNI